MASSSSSIMSSFFYLSFFFSIQISVLSFSVDLIDRDSPQSPLYNPSSNHYHRLNNAFERSISRASYFKNRKNTKSMNDIQSQILPSGGAYVMKLSIGTPPVSIFAIADTGSDIIWTQCKPCPNCFKQTSPLFDPNHSSTFRKVSCDAEACSDLGSSTCSSTSNTCQYSVSYGDQSYSIGDLARDTFTVGSTSGKTISISNIFFGCGHDNSGTFSETSTGIIGLGGGAISFVQQLSNPNDGKFSYCLVPLESNTNVSGKINFGDSAIVSGRGVVSTPLIKKSDDTFYYLTLESISVGNKSLVYQSTSKSSNDIGNEEGNVIIDSGTTLTLLPSDFTEVLESELKQSIDKAPTTDPPSPFGLCYNVEDNIRVPAISVKFTGAEMELSGDSTFVQISDNLVCLAIVASKDFAIYGNMAQRNYLVGYDLVNSKVSFKPTNCSKN